MGFYKLRVYRAAEEFSQTIKVLLPTISYRFKHDKDQLERAASSVPYNIAEAYGVGRDGRKLYHLAIARGSIDEARAVLYALLNAGAITLTRANPLILKARAIAKMLTSLIEKISAE